MKSTFFFVILVAALPVIALAQPTPPSAVTPLPILTNSVPQATDASLQNKVPVPGESFVLPKSTGQLAAPATPPAVDGALVRAARAGQIWQAVNPLAPAEFGQGYDNVTLDPHTRQPSGVVLVSFPVRRIGPRASVKLAWEHGHPAGELHFPKPARRQRSQASTRSRG